jgi:uncharacterized membrane protein YcfT
MQTGRTRLDWVDTAKGISILLVVLVHAAHWLEYAGVSSRALTDLNEALSTLRMPLFFCMSGLFAAKWLDKPWRELWRGKLSLLLWVFIVWQPMVLGYKLLAASTLPDQEDSSVVAHLARFVLSPVRPSGELWFLWGLVLFFVAAKVLSRLPAWLHLGIAAVVSAAWWGIAEAALSDGVLRILSNGWRGAATYYLFFVIGILGRKQILAAVAGASRGLLFALVLLWAAVMTSAVTLDVVAAVPVALFFLKLLGLVGGVGLAVLLSDIRALVRLGSQTLQVYVAHTTFVVLIAVILAQFDLRLVDDLAAFVLPPLVVAVAVALSLALHRAVLPTRARFLYVQPDWFARAERPRLSRLRLPTSR